MDNKKELTIGIDFGTTNTVVSYFKKNPIIFKDSIKELIPTKIYFGDKINCGNYIPINISSDSNNEQKNILSNFKTKIGSNPEYFINKKIYTDKDVITIFFKHIKDLLKRKFGNIIFNTVLTVPSNFNDNQRKILMNIATFLGFNILRIINEPTAAAFAYGLNNNIDDEKIMVFDLGGGTLDVSILEIDDNFFETIDSIGINNLGGNDFTKIIYDDCLKEFKNTINKDTLIVKQSKLLQLLYNCNRAKEKLSWIDSCTIKISDFYKISQEETIDLEYNLDKIKFKNICKPLLDRISRKLSTFKKEYTVSKLILVGGSSKLKIVQNLLEDEFNIKPLIHNNLQQVVSLGACYYGAMIRKELSDNEIILVDNLPLSLGVETAEGIFSVIIPKNTPLPATKSQKYTIDTPGEEIITVKVYQGERTIANKNYLIGEFEFNKISKIGMPIINITFRVDINGLINITIQDKHSGESKDILIRNIDDNISLNLNKILKEAEEFKELDQNEMIRTQLYYKIEGRIENILNNLNINNLIAKSRKDEMTENLIESLDNIDNLLIPDLIKLDKRLDEEFFILLNNSDLTDLNNDQVSDTTNKYNELNIETVIIQEKIEFMRNKIDFYMLKDIDDFKKECLIKLNKFLDGDNINQKDIDEKMEYMKQLFTDSYKEELMQLCMFLKGEIENKNLNLDDNQYIVLSKIVTKYLDMLDSNNSNIDYKEEINNLNKVCENILTKK